MKIIKSKNIKWDEMGVYVFENVNGKKYIGSTVKFKDRFASHCSMLRNDKHTNYFQNAYNETTSKFTFSILEYVDDVSELRKREVFHINENKSLSYQNGYNILEVDDNGYFHHSDETKQKISDANTGKIPYIDAFGIRGVATKGDIRWLTGEIEHNTKGFTCAIDIKSKESFQAAINDPRWETGEIVGINKGKTTMKHYITGVTEMVYMTDERVQSGELVGISKGIQRSNAKGIIVDGIAYRTLEEAYTKLEISKPTFRKLINSKKYTISESPLTLELNGHKPHNGIIVVIDGVSYKSIAHAAKLLNSSHYKIKHMLTVLSE